MHLGLKMDTLWPMRSSKFHQFPKQGPGLLTFLNFFRVCMFKLAQLKYKYRQKIPSNAVCHIKTLHLLPYPCNDLFNLILCELE